MDEQLKIKRLHDIENQGIYAGSLDD